MPRGARATVGGVCYHVLNRGNARMPVVVDLGDADGTSPGPDAHPAQPGPTGKGTYHARVIVDVPFSSSSNVHRGPKTTSPHHRHRGNGWGLVLKQDGKRCRMKRKLSGPVNINHPFSSSGGFGISSVNEGATTLPFQASTGLGSALGVSPSFILASATVTVYLPGDRSLGITMKP